MGVAPTDSLYSACKVSVASISQKYMHVKQSNFFSRYHYLPGENDVDRLEVPDEELHENCILAPFKVRK